MQLGKGFVSVCMPMWCVEVKYVAARVMDKSLDYVVEVNLPSLT